MDHVAQSTPASPVAPARPPLLLGDVEVRAAITPDVAVAAAREALIAHDAGALVAPPRVQVPLAETGLAFTVGAQPGGASGFRVYRTGEPRGDQLVVVWSAEGRLQAVIWGDELGVRRTGALGAAVTGALARPDATRVGVVGTGAQAWSQLWATTACRSLDDVAVHSRDPGRREAFARRARRELGVSARACDTAAEAVRDADVVILATRSPTPVIDADDVAPGTHVVTVGPKTVSAHETPPALVGRAALITCDSPAQAAAYEESFFTPEALVPAGAVLAGRLPGRTSPEEITLHCSVGLAGSEIVLARRLLEG